MAVGRSSPTVAPAATASPAAEAPTPSLGEGPLQPGRYGLSWDGPPMTIEVPAGWEGTAAGVGKFGENAEVAWGGWSEPVTRVFGDACQERDDHVPVDGTLQGLVDALDAQGSTDATITDVTIGGFAGKRVMLAPSTGRRRGRLPDRRSRPAPDLGGSTRRGLLRPDPRGQRPRRHRRDRRTGS